MTTAAAAAARSIADRRAGLEARAAELRQRLAAIEAELDSHVERDWEEAAVEREGDEVLQAEGTSGLQEIRQIEAALKRMEDGAYGLCARCGTQIAPERLDALPFTPFCRDCAA